MARIFSFLIVFVTVCLSVPVAAGSDPAGSGGPEPITLESGWWYRWGDSPVDTSGALAWLKDPGGQGWRKLPRLEWLEDRDGREWVWYRTTLPSVRYTHAVVYLPSVAVAFEVYVGDNRVYRYGSLSADPHNKYAVTDIHVIPVPPDYAGKPLSVRVFSNVFVIGVDATSESPLFGSERDVLRRILLRGVESTAVGFLLVFAGLFSLLTFFVRFRENLFAPLSFAAFSICLGIFVMLSRATAQLLIDSTVFKLYSMTLSFLFFPVGMFAYLQQTIFRAAGPASRRVIWAVFFVHLGAALIALILDLTGVHPISLGMRPYNVLFAATVPVTLFVTIKQARRGSTEAKIAAWGFVVFGTTGLLDLLQGLDVITHVRWISHWGALLFVGALGYVLERQFTDSHRRLQESSRQLREKSEQLQEYSRTLEEKVLDRTRTLDEKNRELEGTLKELRETQEQLIITEKMASLGSLVAGVAHEVNNPIGAVISASDVSTRCADAVRDFVEKNAGQGDVKVKKASVLLDENNRVIAEAARRVSKIVRSLKNFARLDEADFQNVDIRDGLESTLTLVKHLTKDRIEVEREYGDLPKLAVYPNQLNQVFMNLIVNAIDAIDGKGTITIRTHGDGTNAYVAVSDTGKGIPESHIRRVFDPGFTTKGVGVGTGLGLSISYNIVRKHGGRIDVESEPGRGATFTIVLPLRSVPKTDRSPRA